MLLKDQLIVKANTPNRNGRIYTDECLKEIKEQLDAHEESVTNFVYDNKDNVENPSILDVVGVITDYKVEDNLLKGNIEILDTPKGKLIEEKINKGENIYFSINGVGDLNDKDEVENYEFKNFIITEADMWRE